MTSPSPPLTKFATGYAEVIGDPVSQSKSPIIHGFWLEQLGMEAEYRRTRVSRSELSSYIEERRADPAWLGCNVTMPLKLDALLRAGQASDAAVQAGACNTLVPGAVGLVASNTDVGAIELVLRQLTRDRATASITLLGTGGAARAVLVACASLGFRHVAIQARDQEAAFALANSFGMTGRPDIFEAPVRTDGLINATPLGMTGSPPLTIGLDQMPANGWVFDLITAPDPTPLVTAAKTRGMGASGGLTMLVEQAAAAFPLFFGVAPPRTPELDALLYDRLTE
jgi:shikimate dehydrogenase